MTQVSSLASQRSDQQDALDSATRAFALAETRYQAGLSDQILMLDAENTLLQAREQMAGPGRQRHHPAHHPAAVGGRRLQCAADR